MTPFSAKQDRFLKTPLKDLNMVWGVTGSGKSYIANLLFFYHFIKKTPKNSVAVITGVSSDTIEMNVVKPMIEFDPSLVRYENKRLIFPEGREALCIGAYTENADKRIQGIPHCAIQLQDEASKLPQTFVEMAHSRAKSPTGEGGIMVNTPVIMTFNAGHPANYIKQKFLDHKDWVSVDKDIRETSRWREFVFWAEDNPRNTKQFIEEQKKRASGLFLQRMYLNQWVASSGGYFDRSWCEMVHALPAGRRIVRYWDLASTKKTEDNDPDYTATVKMSRAPNGIIYVEDFFKGQWDPGDRDNRIKNTASVDGQIVEGGIEKDPGQAGKDQIRHLINHLIGYNYVGVPVNASRGSKDVRFSPFSSQAKAGNVKILHGSWNSEFFDDLESFDGQGKLHDDTADACSGAFWMLTNGQAKIEFDE